MVSTEEISLIDKYVQIRVDENTRNFKINISMDPEFTNKFTGRGRLKKKKARKFVTLLLHEALSNYMDTHNKEN